MKRQKDRVTRNQFDQAIMEEIEHRRNTNVPKNALSMCLTFSELVSARLFGERTSYSPGVKEAFDRTLQEARAERAQVVTEQQAEVRKREADERASRIIMPGHPKSNRMN